MHTVPAHLPLALCLSRTAGESNRQAMSGIHRKMCLSFLGTIITGSIPGPCVTVTHVKNAPTEHSNQTRKTMFKILKALRRCMLQHAGGTKCCTKADTELDFAAACFSKTPWIKECCTGANAYFQSCIAGACAGYSTVTMLPVPDQTIAHTMSRTSCILCRPVLLYFAP